MAPNPRDEFGVGDAAALISGPGSGHGRTSGLRGPHPSVSHINTVVRWDRRVERAGHALKWIWDHATPCTELPLPASVYQMVCIGGSNLEAVLRQRDADPASRCRSAGAHRCRPS